MQNNNPSYLHAPITEAVLEIVFSDSINDNALHRCVKKFQKSYPNSQAVFRDFQVQLQVSEDGNHMPSATQGVRGVRLLTKDALNIIQLFPNRISLSRLPPYNGWDNFSEEFMNIWSYVKESAKISQIRRIAARYINRIDVPIVSYEEIVEVGAYLNVGVTLPSGITIGNYQTAMQIIMNATTGAVVRTGTQAPIIPDTAALFLDVDCYIEDGILSTEKEIRAKLTSLRDIKNLLFEQFITDKARSIFNGVR